MMNDSHISFSPGQNDDEVWTHQYLRTVKDSFEEIRAILLYKVNQREIGVAILNGFDQELRSIYEQLATNPILKATLKNTHSLTEAIDKAKMSINLAIDLQNMRQTYENRKRLYLEYKNIAIALSNAIDILDDALSTPI